MEMVDFFLDCAVLFFFVAFLVSIVHLIISRRSYRKIVTKIKSLEENDKRICEMIGDSQKKIDEIRLQLGIINGTIIRTIHVAEPAPMPQVVQKRPRGRPPKKIEQQN